VLCSDSVGSTAFNMTTSRKGVNAELIAWADLVLTMTKFHKRIAGNVR